VHILQEMTETSFLNTVIKYITGEGEIQVQLVLHNGPNFL